MLAPGTRVTHAGRANWGNGEVLRCSTHLGGDGRHWVKVRFGTWEFHTESKDLEVLS